MLWCDRWNFNFQYVPVEVVEVKDEFDNVDAVSDDVLASTPL